MGRRVFDVLSTAIKPKEMPFFLAFPHISTTKNIIKNTFFCDTTNKFLVTSQTEANMSLQHFVVLRTKFYHVRNGLRCLYFRQSPFSWDHQVSALGKSDLLRCSTTGIPKSHTPDSLSNFCKTLIVTLLTKLPLGRKTKSESLLCRRHICATSLPPKIYIYI